VSGEGAETSARGLPFVVAAPSGTGKTTVCRRAIERDPRLCFSVSHTTRPPRAGERNGVDYHFVSAEEFRELVGRSVFLEYAEFNGHLYGTSWEALERPLEEGRDLIVEIEVQGARQLRERRPDACFVFLLPPSMAALGERLRGRATDSPETIEKRLAIAENELRAIGSFDYALVNDDLEGAVDTLLEIVEARRRGRGEALERKHGAATVYERWRQACDSAAGRASRS
jgi:guanylate kinase